jgi:hypothetical protein
MGTMIKKINGMMVLCILAMFVLCIPPASAISPNWVVVKGSLNTTENNGVSGQGINIDGLAGSALSIGKVKRYTVTIFTGGLYKAPAGMDRIDLYTGVLSGNTTYAVRLLRQDLSTSYSGMTLPVYVGTNSFFNICRGADGLGPVTVQFNAVVEVEP